MSPFTLDALVSAMDDPETPLGWPKGWRRPNVHPVTELRAAVLESRRRAASWFRGRS